ncbi:MAG: metallophosphoesterase [Lachnospiraceae bacterium]|nr:metallophosphoesterase [Lachnospiraceae bacterium]
MNPVYRIILILIVLFLIFFAAVLFADNRRFVVRRYVVRDRRIAKPVRYVLLTDLHEKVYPPDNEKIVDAVREIGPDAVLLGGDLIVYKKAVKGGDFCENSLSLVRRLAAAAPVFYVNGNHEQHLMEDGGKDRLYERFADSLKACGVCLLHNSGRDISGTLLQGLELPMDYYERFHMRTLSADRIESMIGQNRPDVFTVLLTHTPDQFEAYADWGADLCLCGHIHGGVARLPLIGGIIGPQSGFFPRYSAGVYERPIPGADKRTCRMILSCGMGMHKMPLRFMNPGEISVIELVPQEA